MKEAIVEITVFILELALANNLLAFRLNTRFIGTKIISYIFFTIN
jgi:hypothetical protein